MFKRCRVSSQDPLSSPTINPIMPVEKNVLNTKKARSERFCKSIHLMLTYFKCKSCLPPYSNKEWFFPQVDQNTEHELWNFMLTTAHAGRLSFHRRFEEGFLSYSCDHADSYLKLFVIAAFWHAVHNDH